MFQVFQMTKGESSDELILGEPSPHDETRTVKKRNRVLQSCIPCHELRRKCDRQRPCGRCKDHGSAGSCVYQLEDPGLRSGEYNELTYLRKRVEELEHTVKVLTHRHRDEDKVGSSGSSRPGEDKKKPGSPSSNRPGTANSGQSSPGGSGAHDSIKQCGCATSTVGRQILTQLLAQLADAIARLKAIPEHQRSPACPLYAQIVRLHGIIAEVLVILDVVPLQQAVYPSSAPQQSYGVQSPYAPTASSHSSASPPQTIASDFMAFGHNDPTFDLSTPAEPYPYNAPHSSTLSHTLSHSLSHPQLSSGAPSHGHHNISYTLGGVHGLGSPTSSYQQYQPAAGQSMQNYTTSMGGMSRPGPVSSTQGSSLSTWNSMGGASTSAAQPMYRPSSKSNRSPSSRPAK